MNAVTLNIIRNECGYSNYDAMRQAWYTYFGKEGGFPGKDSPLDFSQAELFLSRLSAPKPNKPDAVVQGALRLLEGLRSESGIKPVIDAPVDLVKITRPAKVKTNAIQHRNNGAAAMPILSAQNLEEQYKIERLKRQEDEERTMREEYRREEAAAAAAAAAIDKKLTPWISALTWVLNALEMMFLVFGLYIAASVMGAIVGLFLAVLGTIVLLIVRLQGDAGGYAVFAWLLVCSIGGWLVEYPAMLQAVETTGSIVSSSGSTYAGIETETYAAILTFLMSGSSFAGTFFRYKKSIA